MKKNVVTQFLFDELKAYVHQQGFPRYTARQIFEWIYKRRIEDFSQMTNISQDRRNVLAQQLSIPQLDRLKLEQSTDGTEKWLLGLHDGAAIECVLIPEAKRLTLCVSTQVGCKFGCTFCCSGQGGFKRNLEAWEIVAQYLTIADYARPRAITNIVFMGIGEPLDNFDHTVRAINILRAPEGLGLGKRRLCVSTCGLPEKIKQLAQLRLGVKLSISLHSADNVVRSSLMPINNTYPLELLMEAVREYSLYESYPVSFEYTLLKGVNTRQEDAKRLAQLLTGISYKLNIIPLNVSQGESFPPNADEIDSFCYALKKKNIFYTLRKPRGQDIHAACGQLRSQQQRESGTIRPESQKKRKEDGN